MSLNNLWTFLPHPRRRSCAAATVALLLQAGAPTLPAVAQTPPPAAGVGGIWIDHTGDGAVEIALCGDRLCGRIVWLKEPVDKAGRPLTDGNNPEPGKRRRAICGLPIIGDLRRMGGVWDAGWIYDPKDGKSYDLEIRTRPGDRLQVTGYIGTKFLSETFTWTRAPAGLKRCDQVAAQ